VTADEHRRFDPVAFLALAAEELRRAARLAVPVASSG
jgi:hypothetical protein